MQKTSKVSIIVAVVNMACLCAALLNPSELIMVTVLPLYVSALMWTFLDQYKESSAGNAFFFVGLLSGTLTLIIALICKIQEDADSFSHYIIVVPKTIAIFGGDAFDYFWFALFVFITISALFVGEIMVGGQAERAAREDELFNTKVRKAIRYLT